MGKKTRTTEEWQAIIAEQEASGQGQTAWCKEHGINLYTYRDRASRLRKTAGSKDTAINTWVEIKSESMQTGAEGNGKSPAPDQPDNQNSLTGAELPLTHKKGKLVIKIGTVKLYAGTAYPTDKLAALVRELVC